MPDFSSYMAKFDEEWTLLDEILLWKNFMYFRWEKEGLRVGMYILSLPGERHTC